MDQPGRVLACLEVLASPSADPGSVKAAESALASEAAQPGYGVLLCRLALGSAGLHPGLRQAAAVLLKRYVKGHWVEGERGFEPPQASDADKAAIRAALPAGLGDADARVRGAVGGAIAAVAAWDWPGAWPGLLESLVASIKAGSDPHLLMGCVQCLSVMASDLDHESAPQLLQALSPELSALAASPGTPKGLAATCFSIMADLTSSLAALSGSYQRQVREMLGPLLPPWVQLACNALATDMKLRADWPVKLAALRLSQPLVTYFSKPLEASMPPLMGATWQLLLAAQPVHQALLVEGADEDDVTDASGVDDDEEPVQLETLLSQQVGSCTVAASLSDEPGVPEGGNTPSCNRSGGLFELLLSFVGPSRFARQLEAALPQMVYVSIAYLQMTQEQAEAWSVSANQFVADEEEDIISCRASSELLLTELLESFPSALPALLEGVGRRLPEADAAAGAGQQAWWQMREAALQAVAACGEQLMQAVQQGALPAQQLQQLLDTLLQRDLQPLLPGQQQQQQRLQLGDAGRQFLLGRALRVCAKLHEAASPAQRQSLLQAAAAAVMTEASPAVHVSAYKALAALCPGAPAAQLAPLCGQLLGALVARLGGAEEEVLHLVLEVLEVVIGAAARAGTAAPGGAALVSPEQAMAVAQPVLQAWAAHTADPLIGPDAQAVIAAIAELPGCLPSLAAAAAPTLAGFVSRGAAARKAARQGGAAAAAAASASVGTQESPMLVEASLDLLGTLVAPGQPAVAAELARGILGPLLDLIASTDDPSELQSAVALLLQLLRACPPPELAAAVGSGGPEQLLCRLLVATRALLAPAQPDSCVGVAGPLLAQLLKAFPAQLAAPAPAELLAVGDTGAATAGAAHPPSCLGLLLGDAVRKMGAGGCSPATLAGLLEFVVKLALLDTQQLVEQLAAMQVAQPGGAATSGLAVVVPLWLEHATDMPSSLLTRQMAAALLQLLQLRNHAALASLTVPGRPVEAAGGAGGRVTRSRARQQGGLQYTQVPAAVKTLQVLGELLAADAEASAGGLRGLSGADGEGEWADEYESDEDDDGDEAGAAGMRLTGSALRGLPAELLHEDVISRSAGATPVPDDPADADEPLLRLSLRSLLRQGLGALAAADSAFLQAAAAQLGSGSAEVVALQQLLSGDDGGGRCGV